MVHISDRVQRHGWEVGPGEGRVCVALNRNNEVGEQAPRWSGGINEGERRRTRRATRNAEGKTVQILTFEGTRGMLKDSTGCVGYDTAETASKQGFPGL